MVPFSISHPSTFSILQLFRLRNPRGHLIVLVLCRRGVLRYIRPRPGGTAHPPKPFLQVTLRVLFIASWLSHSVDLFSAKIYNAHARVFGRIYISP